MNQEIRFGLVTLQHIPWKKEVKRWKSIEALGFDGAWVGDHFANPFQPTAPWFESWTLLASLASCTSHIRIGTLVTSIPLRNPAVLARQALTVDHISNGRLELGLGAGVSGKTDPVYSMTGIEDWAPPERVARFHEIVEIVDQCLRNRITTYEGRYYKLKNTAMSPPPIQQPRPPITIAAMGPSMLRIAARYADTWNSLGGEFGAPPETIVENIKHQNRLLDDCCAKIGRNPKTLRRSLLVFGLEAETVFDSEEAFKEVVERYLEVGITEFMFFHPDTAPSISSRAYEQIALEVIPELRRSNASMLR
ncbi:MAG: LLM class flavin-dependent oxidoreductase [Candidatus Bathyarchaeota archaeon]|nr:MAG: LLM class flavin-dependent oxidoreductase [Candidatus Bathyarchaeota archaeon]